MLFGFAGLLFSALYVVLASKKYEAVWQLQMAQYFNSNSNSNSEEPAALIQRLSESTVYPVSVLHDCAISGGSEIGSYLGGILEVNTVKSISNVVELKVRESSQDQAKKCAVAIVDMIGAQQSALIEDHLAGRKELLIQYQQALKDELQELGVIKKSELVNFGYLAKFDRLSRLRSRIDSLQEESMLSKLHPTKLTMPVHVSSKSISTGVMHALLAGLIVGLLLGVLYSFWREDRCSAIARWNFNAE